MVRHIAAAGVLGFLLLACDSETATSPSADAGTIPPDGQAGGALVHDAELTIVGSGFGSRSEDPASFFETWDWGTVDAPASMDGSPWLTNQHEPLQDPARFSDEATRGGRGLNLRAYTPDRVTGSDQNDTVYRGGLGIGPGEKVYIANFVWSTYGGAREFGDGCPQQWKIMNWLLHDRLSQPCTSPSTGLTWNAAGVDGTPSGSPHLFIQKDTVGMVAEKTVMVNWQHQPPEETWWQVEIEYQVASAAGVEDGHLRLWFDGQLLFDAAVGSWGEGEHDACVAADGYVYDMVIIRNYIQWSAPETSCPPAVQPDTIRHDDTVYQIGSFARVALGNADTWEACTVREYQPIVSWSDTAITIVANQGAFQAGESGWLYVVDDSGAVVLVQPVVVG